MTHKIAFFLLLLGTCLGLNTPTAQSGEPAKNCLDQKDVDELFTEFQFGTDSPKVSAESYDNCDMSSPETVTFAGLIFLKKFAHLPLISTPIDQHILGEDAWTFFRSRIRQITFTRDGEGWCGYEVKGTNGNSGQAAAYAGPDHIMHVCNSMADNDVFDVASMFVHEARHVEGFSHVGCLRGFLTGWDNACDTSYHEKGSYAVGAEYTLRIAQHPKLDPVVATASRLQGLSDLFMRFNKVPFGLRSALLLQDTQNQLWSFDGRATAAVEGGKPNQILAERLESNLVFDLATTTATSFSSSLWLATPGFIAKQFRAGVFSTDQASLVDALFGADEYSCLLFSQELRCIDSSINNPSFFSVRLERLHPLGFIFRTKSHLVKAHTAFLVGDDGYLYELPSKLADLKNANETNFKKSASPSDFLKILNIPGAENTEYVITRSGKLMHTKGNKKLFLVPGFEDKTFRSMAPTVLSSQALLQL